MAYTGFLSIHKPMGTFQLYRRLTWPVDRIICRSFHLSSSSNIKLKIKYTSIRLVEAITTSESVMGVWVVECHSDYIHRYTTTIPINDRRDNKTITPKPQCPLFSVCSSNKTIFSMMGTNQNTNPAKIHTVDSCLVKALWGDENVYYSILGQLVHLMIR